MMRVVGMWLLFAVLGSSLLAQSGKAEVERLNRQYAKDLVAKDYLAIERFLENSFDRDFKWNKDGGQTMVFGDLWEGNRQDMENKKKGVADGPLVFNVSFTNWKQRGSEATIDLKTTGRGEWHKDGVWIPVMLQLRVRQTWRQVGSKWMAVRFQDLSADVKFGKPQKSRLKA
jgi:hypothetical protein